MNHRILLLTAAAFAATAGPALATIELKFDQVEPSGGVVANLAYNGSSVSARIGQMLFHAQNQTGSPPLDLIDGPDADATLDDLLTFCIELGQQVSGDWNEYSKTAISDAPNPSISGSPSGYSIGLYRARALDLLADNYWDDATTSSLIEAVAFQLSVWEIVHESPSGSTNDPPLATLLDVSDNAGTFFVSNNSPTGTLASAIAKANTWLSEVAEYFDGDSDYGPLTPDNSLSLIALTNRYKQDQVVQYVGADPQTTSDLPEPVSAIAWGGLLSLCLLRRARV